ncbi:DUF423 domain-containing protein [Luteimonas sp. 3794]|uniref:DUF423 domain-containing protein n=1 Tax=Luteimonas sp. 3794 TaxID=2817730 RepID=UPI0028583F37|nr:DUF423 domain-containing protein [Luteimonas sp. 3794]MDR6992085.1 uncharacterized membrane protein YgdD (TMEM256/DUF423 family) [Luteimonas sp. 3794]
MRGGSPRGSRNVGALVAVGALLAGLSVGLSAYASHAVDGDARAALQTAAVFAFGHGIVLVVLGRAVRGTLELASLVALLIGTLLFAGALVSRHLFGGPSFFAPWGGMLTMLGWLLQAVAAVRR